jgi:hypothetical protein
MQYDPRDLFPIRAIAFGIEQSKICDQVLLIINTEQRRGRSATPGSSGGICMVTSIRVGFEPERYAFGRRPGSLEVSVA